MGRTGTENGAQNGAQVLADTEARIAELMIQNAALKADVRELRKRARPRRGERIIIEATANAKILADLAYAGLDHSRRYCDDTGLITAWRWGWARGMIRLCRIRLGRLEDDAAGLEAAHRAIDAMGEKLLLDGGKLTRLRARAGARYARLKADEPASGNADRV